MMLRLIMSTGSLFLSLLLGAILLGIVGYNSPETLSMMLGWARQLKAILTSTGLDPKYNIWVEVLLEERQLLFMFFTIAARIVIELVMGMMRFLFSRN